MKRNRIARYWATLRAHALLAILRRISYDRRKLRLLCAWVAFPLPLRPYYRPDECERCEAEADYREHARTLHDFDLGGEG